jgi:hypothetical protein
VIPFFITYNNAERGGGVNQYCIRILNFFPLQKIKVFYMCLCNQ